MNSQQRPRFLKDRSNELENIGKKCIAEHPVHLGSLGHLSILYAFRDPARYDQKRVRTIEGECLKLSSRERDLYGYDICILIARSPWKTKTDEQKYKLIWHELKHIDVVLDEAAQPATDDHGRKKIHLRLHDLNMERFSDELDLFGFDPDEKVQARKLVKIYKKHNPTAKSKS